MGEQLRLIHTIGDRLELRQGERQLFTYVYAPTLAERESPQPYFHPLWTLAGEQVTLFRPHDHVWHKGLAMTSAHLSGENFWGGPTFVNGQGYVQLPNNGSMRHRAWDELRCAGDEAAVRERLEWTTQAGETWLAEERRLRVAAPDETARAWALDLAFALRNVRGQPLIFGSPTTAGRRAAGYGGLFWRGPRSFLHGTILAGGALAGPDVMGQPAPWLAFVGRHDGSGRASTLLFRDHPANPRYPTKWFVRNEPYACASCAFMFDEEYPLASDDTLTLRYQVVIADDAWSREQIERHVAEQPLPDD